MRKFNAVVMGYYGAGNVGDELLCNITSTWLRELGGHVTVTSIDEDYTHPVHADFQTVGLYDLAGLFKAVGEADLLVLGGGGIFHDYWPGLSPQELIRFPSRHIVQFAQNLLIGQQFAVPVVLFAQGLGPLRDDDSRRLVADVYRAAAHISFRDQESKDLMNQIGVDRDCVVAPDPIFSKFFDKIELERQAEDYRIGFVVREWPFSRGWQDKIKAAIDWILEHPHIQLRFINFGGPSDEKIIAELAHGIPENRHEIVQPYLTPLEAHKAFLGLKGVVSMRLHAQILGANLGLPQVVLEYDPKLSSASSILNVPRRARVSLDAPVEAYVSACDQLCFERSRKAFQVPMDHIEATAQASLAHKEFLRDIVTSLDVSPRRQYWSGARFDWLDQWFRQDGVSTPDKPIDALLQLRREKAVLRQQLEKLTAENERLKRQFTSDLEAASHRIGGLEASLRLAQEASAAERSKLLEAEALQKSERETADQLRHTLEQEVATRRELEVLQKSERKIIDQLRGSLEQEIVTRRELEATLKDFDRKQSDAISAERSKLLEAESRQESEREIANQLRHALEQEVATRHELEAAFKEIERKRVVDACALSKSEERRNLLEYQVAALLKSTSWRVMAPLRAASETGRLLARNPRAHVKRIAYLRQLQKQHGLKYSLRWLGQRITYATAPAGGGMASPAASEPLGYAADSRSLLSVPASIVKESSLEISVVSPSPTHQISVGERNVLVMYTDNFLEGGLERVVLDMCLKFRARGHHPVIVAAGVGGLYAAMAQELGIEFVQLNSNEKALEDFLHVYSATAVLSHHCFRYLEQFAKRRVPILEVVHNVYFWLGDNAATKHVIDDRNKFVSRFIAVSDFVKSYSSIAHAIPDDKIQIVCNGLNNEGLVRPPIELLTRRRLATLAQPQLVFVANLSEQKNHRGVIRAMGSILSRFPRANLTVVGSCSEEHHLYAAVKAEVDKLSRRDAVRFVGQIDRSALSRLLAESHVALLPTYYEGFSIASLEYTYFALPLVLSETGASQNLAAKFGHVKICKGVAIRPDELSSTAIVHISEEELDRGSLSIADSVTSILENYSEWLDHAEDAARRFDEYSIDSVVDAYENIIQEVCAC